MIGPIIVEHCGHRFLCLDPLISVMLKKSIHNKSLFHEDKKRSLKTKFDLIYEMLRMIVRACRAVGYKEFDSESSQAEHKLYALLDEAEVALNEISGKVIDL